MFDADSQEIRKPPKDEHNHEDEEDICKYCYFEDISENPVENLKLYPCICTVFVHFLCLKRWF